MREHEREIRNRRHNLGTAAKQVLMVGAYVAKRTMIG